jgi:hypothetical protein
MTDVTISRACLQHVADALDQCKAEVDEALTFPSSPPPPLGMREALERIRTIVRQYAETYDAERVSLGAYEACSEVSKIASAALTSSDDGWVKVDESHPLPHDLQAGDMVKTVKTATVLKRTNDLIWVEAAFSTLGYETMKVEAPTHYRRRPSAEQGG